MSEAEGSTAFRDLEHAGWERSAANYHGLFGAITTQADGAILDAAGVGPGARVLDAPSGAGGLSAAASAREAKVTGLDFSAAMVAEARGRCPDIEFREGDAEALPFEDASFDAVMCHFGLLHFPHPDKAIAEAFRVLAPGGRYAYTTWCPPEKSGFFRLVAGAVKTHGEEGVSLPEGPPMFRFADAEESRKALAAAGFEGPEMAEVPVALRCGDAGLILDVIYKSIVRTRALLEGQPPEARKKIDSAILEGAEDYRAGGEIVLTMPAFLGWARKP